MANIDNLNFEVILDDKDFNKKIKELESIARQFNTNMTNALQIKGQSQNLSQKEVQARRRALQAAVDEARAQEKINREKIKTEGLQRKINAQIERGAKSSKQLSVSSNQFMTTFMQLASFGGMVGLINSLVRITGEFELQKATLGAMLNDMAAAEHLITKIKGLAVESPFTFKELTGYAKQLTAFGVPEEELFETTNMIADLSAGLGVAADRLILAYGQVKSAAFLRGQEVRQFTEAGIPLLQELAEEFEKLEGRAVSVGEVFDRIATRQVSFEMVRDVLREMTSEGGKFYNMQQIQSNTLWGKINKLKDQWEMALNEMGQKNGTVIHNAIDGLIDLIKNWEKVGKILRTLIITFGAYKAALVAAWVISKAITAVKMAEAFVNGIKATRSLTAAIKGMNLSLSATLGFLGGVIGLVYALSTNSDGAAASTHDLNAELEQMYAKSLVTRDGFDADIERLKTLTRGTQEYREALQNINNLYSDYLPKLLSEADSYEDISNAAEQARHSIIETARQRAKEKLEAERDRNLDPTDYDKLISDLQKRLKGATGSFIRDLQKEVLKTSSNIEAYENVYRKYFNGSTPMYDTVSPMSTAAIINDALQYVRDYQNYNQQIANYLSDVFSEADWGSREEYMSFYNIGLNKQEQIDDLKKKQLSEDEYRNEVLNIEKQYLRDLISLYEKLGNITKANEYKKELELLENFWKSWRGLVQDLLLDKGYNDKRSFGLWPTEYTDSTDFIDKIVKDYKDVTEKLDKLHFDPSTQKGLKEQKSVIEAIADLLNIDLTTGKRKGSTGKTELEKKIDALSALKKAYDDLKALNLSDATIIQMLKDNFPDIVSTYGDTFVESLDFTNRILGFGRELKRTEPDRANSILQSLGLDNLSNDKKVIKDAVDAAKKYFEAIRKLQTSDFSIEGEGVAFDIGKIANQLSNKFRDIDLNAKKLTETLSQIDLNDATAVEAIKNTFEKEFGAGSWDIFYEEFVSKGEDAIKDFAQKEKDYERKLAQERLNDIADKYVKEALGNLDMSHWGDKTIGQIETIRQRIMSLMEEGIELPDSTIDKLNELGLSTEDLKVAIKELFGEKYDNATIEKFKALSKLINQVSSVIKSLGNDLEKLGETLGDDMVSDLGKSLQSFEELTKILTECDSLMQALGETSEETKEETSDTAEETKEAAEGLKNVANSSDLITMAIKLATSLISKVVNGINESQKALIDARMAAIEYANALKQLEYNQLMESHESIFGTDEYKQAIDSMRKAAEYQQAALDATKEIGVTSRETYSATNMSFWASMSKGAREVAKTISSLGMGDILVDARTGWQRFWGTGNKLVQSVNISDFIDEEGMLDGEKLREWMKANGEHISQDNKEVLTQMLNDYDLYVQAVEDASAYLREMFNNVAQSMADAYVEAFKASGEAALDYADIMDEVATNIAKSVVKSILIKEIFTPEMEEQVTDLFLGGDRAGALAVIDEAMKSAQALAPEIQALLEELRPYFKMGEDDRQNLADGIKGLTEDTANLLASYLNAIRADVSYSKTLWERMDATTQQIAAALVGFSAPSLIDYQKRIEANTYNTQLYTYKILLELQSVITADGGGGAAVRILS